MMEDDGSNNDLAAALLSAISLFSRSRCFTGYRSFPTLGFFALEEMESEVGSISVVVCGVVWCATVRCGG